MTAWADEPQLFEHLRDLPGALRAGDVPGYLRSLGFGTDALPYRTGQAAPIRHRRGAPAGRPVDTPERPGFLGCGRKVGFRDLRRRGRRARESRHSTTFFPLSRHAPARSSTTARVGDRAVPVRLTGFLVCAVERRAFLVGANPTRQLVAPAGKRPERFMEVTTWAEALW